MCFQVIIFRRWNFFWNKNLPKLVSNEKRISCPYRYADERIRTASLCEVNCFININSDNFVENQFPYVHTMPLRLSGCVRFYSTTRRNLPFTVWYTAISRNVQFVFESTVIQNTDVWFIICSDSETEIVFLRMCE